MKQGIQQVVNLIANNTYTVSAYLRRPVGATAPRVVVTLITGGTEFETYTLASAATLNQQTAGIWVRYDVQVTPAANRNKLSITADGATGTKIDIAAPQLEKGNQKTAYIATNQYTSSGKIIFSGSATTSFEAGPSEVIYTYSGTGGVVFSGTGNYARDKTYTPSGGLVLGGFTTPSKTKSFQPVGGVSFSGTAPVSYTAVNVWSYSPTGGLVLSGTAGVAKIKAPIGSGGFALNGNAPVSKEKVWGGSGGITLDGTADYSKDKSYFPIGGLYFGGAAETLAVRTFFYEGSGTILFSGSALIERIVVKEYVGEGGVFFSGESIYALRVFDPFLEGVTVYYTEDGSLTYLTVDGISITHTDDGESVFLLAT